MTERIVFAAFRIDPVEYHGETDSVESALEILRLGLAGDCDLDPPVRTCSSIEELSEASSH